MDNLFPQPPGEASFVAIGDSFTEGLNDVSPGGGFRGWADRLAGLLAAEHQGLTYANLAIRGKLLRQIVAEQLPAAVKLSPGLVSIAGGGNDLLRPGADPDTLAELFDMAVARLAASGTKVLAFTCFDPVCFPVLRLIRGRVAAYNMHLRAIADARGCYLVDLWSMRFLRSPAAWAPDRIHLTAASHQRVALRAGEVLGVPVIDDWRAPLVTEGPLADAPLTDGPVAAAGASAVAAAESPGPTARTTRTAHAARAEWAAARRADAQWAREYLGPWVNRRLRGASSGDGLTAKRPALEAVTPPMLM
jgi:lysophospholipase L1-like esterase